MRRSFTSHCEWSAGITFALIVFVGGASWAAAADIAENSASRLTAAALEAGAAGDFGRRQKLLDQAIAADPDYEPARWEAGQICIDGQWLPVADAQAAARDDERLAEYLQLRARVPRTPQGHYQLAKWCRRHRLADEERCHWLQVLAADRRNKEALTALDMAWYGNELVSTEDFRQLRDKERKRTRSAKHWKVRIAVWQRALDEGGSVARTALDELRSEVDASAIVPFEQLAAGINAAGPTEGELHRRLCVAFLEALQKMDSFAATKSLTRFALVAPDDSLREYATAHLANHSPHETVPLLISGLRAPIESQFEVYLSPHGNVSYSHQFLTTTSEGTQVVERRRLGRAEAVSTGLFPADLPQLMAAQHAAKQAAPDYANRLAKVAASREQQVAAANAEIAADNERLSTVLSELTGQNLGTDAVAWWDYWRDYNEFEDHDYPTTLVDRRTTYDVSYVPVYGTPLRHDVYDLRPPPRLSCFVAGTPVWTKTGTEPIESLKVGDFVLTRDMQTGELSYRNVIATTTRKPSPMLRIVVNDRELRTTLGHPFWAAGRGWRMAKELEPGDLLHTVGGLAEIASISPSHEEPAHNLIVEGANDYFVGEVGLLVHDNTPRRPELVRLGMR